MASRTASRALRSSLRQAAKAPAVQQRTFVSAVNAASRPALAQAPKAATQFIQQRGVKTIDFAGHKEDVYGMYSCKMRNEKTQWLTIPDRAR
jgi:ketol-acid reductoisomerase